MTATTSTHGIDAVRAGFDAVAAKDLPAFAAAFHPDATWNHRNDDRLGGVHGGLEAIVAFLRESIQLTGGTLSAVPQTFMPDEAGHVAVLTRVSGSRPDGRTFDDTQLILFTLDTGLIRSVDQFIGDPSAVTAFWA